MASESFTGSDNSLDTPKLSTTLASSRMEDATSNPASDQSDQQRHVKTNTHGPDDQEDSQKGTSDIPVDDVEQKQNLVDSLEDKIGIDLENELDIQWEIENGMRPSSLAKSIEIRKQNASKRSLQAISYTLLIEDRLKDMEQRFHKLEQQIYPHAKLKETGELVAENDELPAIELKSKYMGWREFINPTFDEMDQGECLIEVLNEPPYRLHKNIASKSTSAATQRHATGAQPDSGKIERFRIRSDQINKFLSDLMEHDVGYNIWNAHIRPFKALLTFEQKLREKYQELVQDLPEVDIKPSPNVEDPSSSPLPGKNPADAERSDETVLKEHLKVLLEFMDTSLKDHVDLHKRLGSTELSTDAKIRFADLWHLYTPGRKVVDLRKSQAYMVMAVRGGRQHWMQEVEKSSTKNNAFPSVIPEESLSPFYVTCLSIDSNGKQIGPIQDEIAIKSFGNYRLINSLPLVPVECANFSAGHELIVQPQLIPDAAEQLPNPNGGQPKDTKTVLQYLEERGEKFADLVNSSVSSHKEYEGFTLDAVREQVDSQVIIDLEFFYLKHPRQALILGAITPEAADVREVRECILIRDYYSKDERWMPQPSDIFDDRAIDELLTKRFVDDHADLISYVHTDQEALKEKYRFLFPNGVRGFVLRSRKWSTLNIEHIFDVKARTEGFDELVLPEEHKEIVEGLVKTHARGAKPIKSGTGEGEWKVRQDLVRGKGKGLIILLHGVPGVGKTSTAETVAEYTNRPLFTLTCGDIGSNASDVQENLEENFSLAHRWGCVMLLDEADVFLQARSKDDLQRNAVVSVFLRVLEYYSGILFLTTNKVGAFDEAFRSRIHVSLYYKELDRDQTIQIWENNLRRIGRTRKNILVDEKKLMKWVRDEWKRNEEEATQANRKNRPWNGRQIQNACQTAAALAEFKASEKGLAKGKLSSKTLELVAKTTREFDKYLQATHGHDDIREAARRGDRGDDKFNERQPYAQGGQPYANGGQPYSTTFFPVPGNTRYQQQFQQQSDIPSRASSRTPKKRSTGKTSKASKSKVLEDESDDEDKKKSSTDNDDESGDSD